MIAFIDDHRDAYGVRDPMRDEGRPELRQSVWSQPHLKVIMHTAVNRPDAKTPIRVDLGAIFLILELSQSKWLVTSLSPGGGDKMSKYVVAAGNIAGLFSRFAELQRKALVREGQEFPMIVLQEAGLDGFWIHRLLQKIGY